MQCYDCWAVCARVCVKVLPEAGSLGVNRTIIDRHGIRIVVTQARARKLASPCSVLAI